MSSDQPRRRESSGSPGSPMGSTVVIIIAIVAVVAGFLILKSIGGDDNDNSLGDTSTTLSGVTVAPSIDPALSSTLPPTTPAPSTSFVPVVEGATVVVANSSTVNGAAGQLTTALSGKGFTLSKATNSTVKQDASTVLYVAADPEALSVATSIATLMGGIAVSELPSPAPLEGGVVPDGVSVVVMLGNDKANQTLDAMGTPGSAVTTTVPAETPTATT